MRQSPGPPGGLPVPQLTFELNAGRNCVKIGVPADPTTRCISNYMKRLAKIKIHVYQCTEDNL